MYHGNKCQFFLIARNLEKLASAACMSEAAAGVVYGVMGKV
jgi:hypothetical protein